MSTHLPGFQSFFRFLHHFGFAKLATSSIRVNGSIRHVPGYCWGYFRPKHKDAKNFENHLNPVILVFIE